MLDLGTLGRHIVIKKEEGIVLTGLEMVSADRMDSYAGKPGVVIIDLRTPEEFRRGHIRGAVNLPYEEMEKGRRPPRGKLLVLYCERGAASLAMGRELAEEGYQVKSVTGGLKAYRGALLTRGS